MVLEHPAADGPPPLVARDRDELRAGGDRRRCEAPEDRGDSEGELLGGERLGQVIVRPQGEPPNPIHLFPARGEQNHPHVSSLLPLAQLL